jgi:hypothetical protein
MKRKRPAPEWAEALDKPEGGDRANQRRTPCQRGRGETSASLRPSIITNQRPAENLVAVNVSKTSS